MYAFGWESRKSGLMRAYASKAARNTKARWVYPSGLLLRFLINEKGQGALEMRENDRSKPGSALLKRTL